MKNLENRLRKYSKPLLFAIFIFALIIRWWYLPQNAVSFAYDQARDAFIVQDLIKGNLKVLGPPVSGIPGLYHGVLYYYIIAPFYFLGHGNPIVAAYGLSFLLSLGVFIVYFFSKTISEDKIVGLIAALLYAISFESGQYANLLTNASLAVVFVPLTYFGLYLWITRSNKWGPALTGLAFGLAIQSELAMGYHLGPIICWLFVSRKKIKWLEILAFIIFLLIAISTMIIVEFKFGFQGVRGLLYLFTGRDEIAATRGIFGLLTVFIKQTGLTFSYSIFPWNTLIGGFFGFFVAWRVLVKKSLWSKFLLSYIFAHIFGIPFGGGNMRHLMVGAAPAICILMAFYLRQYFWNRKFLFSLILLFLVVGNITKSLKENINGQTIFPLQLDLVLNKELSVVDYTYHEAAGEPFSISSLTSPLYINTLWSYLYNWHGKSHYGYLPYWLGKDQIGLLGNNLNIAPSNIGLHFFIIEPTYGIPERFVGYAVGEQESISEYIEEKKIGELVVQKRIIKIR